MMEWAAAVGIAIVTAIIQAAVTLGMIKTRLQDMREDIGVVRSVAQRAHDRIDHLLEKRA